MRMTRLSKQSLSILICLLTIGGKTQAQDTAKSESRDPAVDRDGTIHVPAFDMPISSLLSPEARESVRRHLLNPDPPPDPDIQKQRAAIASRLQPLIDRQKILYPVDIADQLIAGVPTQVITPKQPSDSIDRKRILINLHGGGFSVCARVCGLIESIPISYKSGMTVISVDYRQGPENKFPAASEDVSKVYSELLKQYSPRSIGIFGCSAGGALTAMSVAWFQAHNLPRPGAIGILCASAGLWGGDSIYTGAVLDGRLPPKPGLTDMMSDLAYFSNASMKDPLVTPVVSDSVMSQFPPTLIITATRAFESSSAIYTHEQLVRLGVDAELQVWDGLFHGFFYDPDIPESRQANDVTVKFFKKHLAE